MDNLDRIIKRFIRINISSLQPRDTDYAIKYLSEKYDFLADADNRELKYLYHQYKLGYSVLDILNSDNFYERLPISEYPHLFGLLPSKKVKQPKVKKSNLKRIKKVDKPSFDPHLAPRYKINTSQIPIFRKDFTRVTLRYIAVMEFKTWIKKNGLKMPQIDLTYKHSVVSDEPSIEQINRSTIHKYLADFKDEQLINDDNYLKLNSLLFNYLFKNESKKLSKPIIVNSGTKLRLASILRKIYQKILHKPLVYEYLLLLKNNIAIFSNEIIKQDNFQASNLYKYCSKKSLK